MAKQKKPGQVILEKWETIDSKLNVSEIKDETVRISTALMLENEATKAWDGGIISEDAHAVTSIASLAGLGMTDGSADQEAYAYRPVAMALLRRVYPDLFAHKIVGVQPINTPFSVAFALRRIYAGTTTEAHFENVPYFAGFTGSTRGTSAALASYSGIFGTSATAADTSAAEAFIFNSTSGDGYPQLEMKLDKVSIEAKTRKLGTSYTLESAQDIQKMHNIDIERELIEALQYGVISELDQELKMRVIRSSMDVANGGEALTVINCSGTTALDGRWSQERYAGIAAALLHQCNKVARSTKIAPANFLFCSPSIVSILQASGHPFTKVTSAVNGSTAMTEVGRFNTGITVYCDQYATVGQDYATVGFKGTGVSQAGVIFSPYIMGLTNKAIDPANFSPRVGVLSRYAITDSLLGTGRYYRSALFTNVSSILFSA